jgi:hypothetical protein
VLTILALPLPSLSRPRVLGHPHSRYGGRQERVRAAATEEVAHRLRYRSLAIDVATMLPSQAERIASPLFRGVLAQVLRAAVEWLTLEEDEVLVCEREEDFDKLVGDGGRVDVIAHQIKDLTDKISARDEEIRESIANFAIAFEHYDRQGVGCQFVFTTTAAAVVQQVDKTLTVDVLKHWRAYSESSPDHRDLELVKSIKGLEQYRKVSTERGQKRYDRVAASHAYLDRNRWDKFLRAVIWRLCAESFTTVRQRLEQVIAQDARFSQFSSSIIVARVVGEVLHRTADGELNGRILRRRDLAELARETADQHKTWAQQRPFALWVAGIEDKLSGVQERLTRLEIQGGLDADEDPWIKYTDWLRPQVDHLSLLGLPTLNVPIAASLPVRLQCGGDDPESFAGRFLHLKEETRILVTGQPGSGKSGLTRLIAGTAISSGLRVVKGRLKVVAAELRRGVPVADAFAASLAEGFFSPSLRKRLLTEADLVLLDGLDETFASHDLIIEHVMNWPGSAKLVLTSRKEEDAKRLDGFVHFQLQPVEPDVASVFARRVGELQNAIEPATLERIAQLFSSHPELATPLLAGFVLAIAFASQPDPVPTSPAKLYERILRLLARTARVDRPLDMHLDPDRAIEIFSSLAWLQMEKPTADLVELKTLLRTAHGSEGAAAVEFWEERGLLESRAGVLRDDIEFAHESLWEFGVAHHMHRLGDGEVERLASLHSDDAKWSQILRFAIQLGHAQAILRGVLSGGEHHRTLRAAQLAMLTSERVDTSLVDRLVEAFRSDIPTLVAEAATFLADVVERDLVDAAVVSNEFPNHIDYTTTWERLGALSIRVSLVSRLVQRADIAAWIVEEANTHRDNSPGFGQQALHWWPTFQDLVVRAVGAVQSVDGTDAAVAFLHDLEKRKLLSRYSLEGIHLWARRESATPILETVLAIRLDQASRLAENAESKRGMPLEDFEEQRFEGLYLVFSEGCPETECIKPDGGVGFALTLESMGYMKRPPTEAHIFMGPNVRGLLAPIVRQWVLALRLEPAAVGNFAREMLPKRPFLRSIIEWPRPPSRVPQWEIERFRAAGIQLADLLKMLNRGSHNGLLVNLLTPMILAWRPSSEVIDLIDSQAPNLNAETWEWLARNATDIWNDRAEEKAEEIVRKLDTPGTIWLLALASKEMQTELRPRLLSVLASTDIVAERAARVRDSRFAAWMLSQQNDNEVLADAWAALRDWTQRPVMDNPRSMPDSPRDLLAQLILERDSSNAVLRELADHTDREVRMQVVTFLRSRPFESERWDILLGTRTLFQMLEALKNDISEFELSWLLTQITNPDKRVRRIGAEALLKAPVSERVTCTLERLQADPDPAVRDKAFEVFRMRSEGESKSALDV